MIDLKNGLLSDILPENLVNVEVECLSYALHKALNKIIEFSNLTRIFSAIDSMPENILDLMAQELNTMYYDQSLDLDTKRIFVKNTLTWYTQAGTAAAVEELAQYAIGDSYVKEWFEIEELKDKPYTFAIETDGVVTDKTLTMMLDMIYRVKNTRSHLMYVRMSGREAYQNHYQGIGLSQHIKLSLYEGG